MENYRIMCFQVVSDTEYHNWCSLGPFTTMLNMAFRVILNVTMLAFHITLLMNKRTKIVVNDG